MATIKDLLVWMHQDLNSRKSIAEHAEYVSYSGACNSEGEGVETLQFRIYTATNRYSFSVRAVTKPRGEADRANEPPIPVHDGYLGCVASSRTPRAGEDWTRGNDLPDGPLSYETWRAILLAIVQYELVRVQHNALATSGVIGAALYRGEYHAGPPPHVNERLWPDRVVLPGSEFGDRQFGVAGSASAEAVPQSAQAIEPAAARTQGR